MYAHTLTLACLLRCVALAGFAHKLITIFRIRERACVCVILAYLAGGPSDGGDSGGGSGDGICEMNTFFKLNRWRIHRHS